MRIFQRDNPVEKETPECRRELIKKTREGIKEKKGMETTFLTTNEGAKKNLGDIYIRLFRRRISILSPII